MVYEPREDSFLILKHVKDYARGRVLDMGTGSGILAEESLKYTDKVLAADIDPEAGKEVSEGVCFVESDLFSNINGKFDLIMFNAPYLPKDKEIDDPALYGGKDGHEIIERFVSDASRFLKDDGKILLVFSSLTDKEKVDTIIYENLLVKKQIDDKKLFFEKLYLYCIEKSDVLKKISNPRLHAKGKRGLVFRAEYGKKDVAVKVKNPKTKAFNIIQHEAKMLEKLNEYRIGPELIECGKEYIIMEFIDGENIEDFVRDHSKEKIRKVITEVFDKLYVLDKIKINKEEMHRPYKHIIVGERVVLIDFERARTKQNTHNVTQFCNYLSRSIRDELEKKGFDIKTKEIDIAAANYSKNKTKKNLEIIRSFFDD